MKNKYLKPIVKIEKLENDELICTSGRTDEREEHQDLHGCSCGCYSRDYKQWNAGCWGCPHCNHDNTVNHICN